MSASTQIDRQALPVNSRAFWWGLLFWALICLAGVLLRGIRWEEGYERAQVLLGITPYPDGHPHARWYWNAFSIHYYVSALLLWLTHSAAIVCGSRQYLAALAVHLPVFGIVWVLTRRAVPAHFAALLSIAGADTVFQSYMPIAPWANKATSGMMGIGWAFWVLAALCAGRWRLAGLLFGLMPLIHIGQWPMLLVLCVVWAGWQWRNGDRQPVVEFARLAAIGLGCCIVFALAQRPFLLPDPESGAYSGGRDGQLVWSEYVTYEDMHRAPVSWPRFGPMGNSAIAMAGFLVLALPVAWREARRRERPAALLLLTYGALCVGAIVVAQIVHRWLGTAVPYIAVGWMPNRLTIHLAMLSLCAAATWAFDGGGARVPWVVLAGMGWLAVLPLWPLLLPDALVQRYFAAPEDALFLAAGGALLPHWRITGEFSIFRWVWTALLAVGLIALTWYYQLAAASVAAGACLAVAERAASWEGRHRAVVGTFALLAACALSGALVREWHTRENLPVSDFEAAAANYLAAHSEVADLVLTPLDEQYQMVLNRPVVATFETRQHIGYMRSLASAADKIYADLYGVKDGHWYDWDLWQRRTVSEWQVLGEAYGFRFVISKDFYPLQLIERVRGNGLVLYEIPPVGAKGSLP